MAQQGLESVADLETYFEGRVLGLARQAGRKYIVWQVNLPLLRRRMSRRCILTAMVVLNLCIQSVSVLDDEALSNISWAAFVGQKSFVRFPYNLG